MIRIIDGKRYNTETAELLAEWNNGLGPSDFHNCSEELYKTKKGCYFICGDGGALSKYSKPCGSNSWRGGCDIIVLTKQEAMEWLEDKNFPSVIEDEFPDLVEDA